MSVRFKILLIGCGKMGSALLEGWLNRNLTERVLIVEPHPPSGLPANICEIVPAPPADYIPDVVVLAVKPQILDSAAKNYAHLAGRSLFISIAAGKTLKKLQAALGPEAAVIRTMPNLPASIGQGITAAFSNTKTTQAQRQMAEQLLSAVGEVVWLDREELMDAVTAVSGSGPAYLFLLAEELEKAAIAAGLPSELAEKLARKTVSGSARLLEQSDLSATQLRENVTSPNGTTAAALEILMNDKTGLSNLLKSAIFSAKEKSLKLSD